jgi:two-component system CheB/CheR fusion protein
MPQNRSKNVAADSGISRRTVDNHRASMTKMGTCSMPALARLVLAAERTPAAE